MAKAEEMAEEKAEEMFNKDSFCLNGWEPSILREFDQLFTIRMSGWLALLHSTSYVN